jgi:hypothetical protein
VKTSNEDGNRKKTLRLLIFLLSGLLVTAASAAVYYSLSTQQNVTVTPPVVAFKEGSDWNSSWSMGTNQTWCALTLKAYPNVTLTYDEPLNLTNTGAAVTIRLRLVSISPASGNSEVSNFTFINFTVHDESGAIMGSLNFTTSGTTWSSPSMSYVTMDASDQWYITVQTQATAGAQSNVATSIDIAVDVQE